MLWSAALYIFIYIYLYIHYVYIYIYIYGLYSRLHFCVPPLCTVSWTLDISATRVCMTLYCNSLSSCGGSSGGEPGATDWSVGGNGENTTKGRPGLEHPGRSGARHKPPDWIVRGGTRGHGLEHPRQRRENGKKVPRIEASGADRSKAQAPELDRPGLHPVPRTGTSGDATRPDWNVRGRSGPGMECPGQQTRRRRRRRRDTERRTRTRARNGWGRTREREHAKREDKEKKVKQQNTWSTDGNNRGSNATRQDHPGAGRHRGSSSESGRGSVRKEQRRRQEPKRRA